MAFQARCRCFVLVTLMAGVLSARAAAQDPVKVGPNIYKTLFENDRVRVCDVRFKPGDSIAMHSHPDHFVYVIAPGKIKLSDPDGKTKLMENKAEEVVWIKAETHSAENIGTTEFHGLVFELKGSGEKAEPPAGVPDTVKAAPAIHKVLFENDRVRVIDVRMKAGDKLPMHSHPAFVVYPFTDSKMKMTGADGKATEVQAKTGQVIWNEPVTHAVENIGTTEAHVLDVELKQ